jgi:hypothetical protein
LSLLDRLKHAFAVNAPLPPPTSLERALIERLAKEIVRRRLTTPALMFLEMSRPMNFLGAQAMHFLAPLITAVCNSRDYQTLASFLERRDAIDLLLKQIETLEAEAARQDVARSQSTTSSSAP